MKRTGIINSNLAGSLGRLGQVDLAFWFGVPTFEAVLSGLLEELVVEGAIADEEVET